MFYGYRNKLLGAHSFGDLLQFACDDICGSQSLGCTSVSLFRSRGKGAIPLPKSVAPNYPVGLTTNFQENDFFYRHHCIVDDYDFTDWC